MSPNRHCVPALLIGCLLATSPQAAEKIYQWRDAEGGVYYGDRPGQADARILEFQAAPPADPDSGDRQRLRGRVLEQFSDEREARRRTAAEQAEAERLRRQNCEHAREQLWRYTHSGYVYELNDDGTRRILDEQERRMLEARTRAAVDQNCK